MKKILYLLPLLFALKAHAVEVIGEITSSATLSSTGIIAAPGAYKQNCLSTLTVGTYVYGSTNAVIRILDGLVQGTTIFSLTISTTNGINSINPVQLVEDPDDPICGSSNSVLQIKNSATSYDINYQGYIRRTR